MSTWEIEVTDTFTRWYLNLTEAQRAEIRNRVDVLEQRGPNLGRPLVAEVLGSSVANLKELRISKGGALRILFAFDPTRTAVLLLGGDKSGQWNDWYREAIPQAERLWANRLDELREEGRL